MHEIAEFLRDHPPFDTLSEAELSEVAAACEIEFAEAGSMVLEQAVTAPGLAWVVRRGAVELLDGERVVDMLSEGEMFGHASLLSEWPTALAVRAAEDSLLYRLPAEAIRPVLARPAALRFAARSLAGRYEMLQRELDPLAIAVVDPVRRPVGRLLHRDPVIAAPAATVQEGARPRGDGAGGRRAHGGGQLVGGAGRPGRGVRHRHGPRPARAGGGGGGARRYPRVAGDDRPGDHHRRGGHRRRCAAGHARPRR